MQRCGFLPRVSHVGSLPTSGFPFGEDDRTDVCPGYSTSLPEVVEVAVAYPQYRARYLAEFLGESPAPEFLYGCATLERAHSVWEADRMRKREASRG